MTTYNSNYEIAQEISARLGTEPIPFDSVLSLCHEIYTELGGDEEQFDNVYEILLEILPLARQNNIIDDTVIALNKTWSSNKLNTELSGKQDTLVAGTNISIDSANTINADGYVWNSTTGGFATIYRQTDEDGGELRVNIATGEPSHAEGYNTQATGDYGSHTEGWGTIASNSMCHAEGYNTKATGEYGAHAEGYLSEANEQVTHAEGRSVVNGRYGHGEGYKTVVTNYAEHAQGRQNISHTDETSGTTYNNPKRTIHSIGIGTRDTNRLNAVEVMTNGDYYLYGVGGYDGVHIKGEISGTTVQTLQEVINNLKTISIKLSNNTVKTYQVKEGTTWIDWVNSDLNVDGFVFKYFDSSSFKGSAIFESANSSYRLGPIINGIEENEYVPAAFTISTSIQYHFYD